MNLTREIKEFAYDIGFCKIGVTPARDFTDYLDEVRSRPEYGFMQNDQRMMGAAYLTRTMPEARSVIVLAHNFAQNAFPEELTRMIGRIYLARCYNPPPRRLNGSRLAIMRDFLAKSGLTVGPDSFFFPGRWAARQAGVADGGRNNFAYVDGAGSFNVLCWFFVAEELEYDSPTLDSKCPPNCRACVDACPTGALQPFRLTPAKCIAFANWMTQERMGREIRVEPALREKLGIRVHGCDFCQEACPRNHHVLSAKLPADPYLVIIARDFTLPRLLEASDEFMRLRVTPIMYNYIFEKKYFQRNAAYALGNQGDPDSVTCLSGALNDPDSLVRGASAWALGRIGGVKARAALERALVTETDADAREEIESAID
jgi:epoxyqueuosine reductase